MPSTLDFHAPTDVFSTGLIKQIHKTLFTIKNGHALPDIIKDTRYDSFKKLYKFKVKNLTFSNGKKLKPTDIKYSLERAVTKRVSGYKRLQNIRGLLEYERKKATDISGIVANDRSGEISLHLVKDFFELPKILSEFRYSIIPEGNKTYKVGLGEFKLEVFDNKKVLISRKAPKSISPSKVVYKLSKQTKAISEFRRGGFHDLWAYPLSKLEFSALKRANKAIRAVPRTYLLMLNPRTLSPQKRKEALLALPRKEIVQRCQPGMQVTDSIVPKGYVGYSDKVDLPDADRTVVSQLPLKVKIAKGTGNEKCVQSVLASFFPKARIEITDTMDGLTAWNGTGVDLWYIYSEAEDTLDFFQYFTKNTSFYIGDPTRTNPPPHEGFGKWKDKKKTQFHQNLLNMHTAVPVFHPKRYVAYDSRYQPLPPSVYGGFLQKYANLKLKERR